MNGHVVEELKTTFTRLLELDDFKLIHKTTLKEVEGWEIMLHTMIISEIEDYLTMIFKLIDLTLMPFIGNQLAIIESNL